MISRLTAPVWIALLATLASTPSLSLAAACPPASLFGPGALYPTNGNPHAIAIGDLDGDGILDLAVVEALTGTVQILRGGGAVGIGDGSFGFVARIPVGGIPFGIVAGDFDADGDLDLAVADNSSSVRVLRNTGGGTFALGTYAAGPAPWSIATADFDRDGRLDLAVTNNTVAGSITVLRGNGDGSFSFLASAPVGQFPSTILTGDFNEDGSPDIAAGVYYSNLAVVMVNNGSGGFHAPVPYLTGFIPSESHRAISMRTAFSISPPATAMTSMRRCCSDRVRGASATALSPRASRTPRTRAPAAWSRPPT